MAQHRFFSALVGLAALTSTSLGLSQSTYAADVPVSQPASNEYQIAQATSSTGASLRSLYVTGTSQINTPANRAVIILSYYPNTYSADYSDSSGFSQIQPADLKLAEDAAVDAGVTASNVKAFPDLASPGSMRIRLVVDNPSASTIEQTINAINTAVVKTNRFINSGASVGYTLSSCQAVESQARQAAMADARARATALAEVAGADIGNIISVSESVSWGTSYSTICPSDSSPMTYTDIYSVPVYDPAAPAAVPLTYSLSVTYDMK
jgi:uncharacterized protein